MKRYAIWIAATVVVAYGLGWVATAGQYIPVWPGLLYLLMGAAIASPLLARRAAK